MTTAIALNVEALTSSSWAGLNEPGVFADAGALIAEGQRKGHFPVSLAFDSMRTAGGLAVPGRAMVATYANHPERCLAAVGKKYHYTDPQDFSTLIHAATAAGAQGTGTFAWKGTIMATFQVGAANGLRTQLIIADSFDGSRKLTCGFSSIRARCANQMSAIMRQDGAGMALLRHTASLEAKIKVLSESIGAAIVAGDSVRNTYHAAESARLTVAQAESVFDALFPVASEDDSPNTRTRAENARSEARQAMARHENNCGPTLATLWNAATWLVDRKPNGETRQAKGGSDMLDSLLFGARGERIQEIQTIVELVMRDGSIQSVTAGDALAMGVDAKQVGRSVLEDMLADLS